MKKSTNVKISIAVAILLAAVFLLRGSPSEHPDSLATERYRANENTTIENATAELNSDDPDTLKIKPRHHGCLSGSFTVISNLPDALQSALFSPGANYPAQIRFSAHHGDRSDIEPNMQGMAIKLFGVPGQKMVRASNPDTHDFLLGSYPVLFSSNIESYLDGLQAIQNGKPLRYFYNPANLQLGEYKLAKKMFSVQTDLTTMRWWSMVPYQFNEGQAVKYSVRPCQVDRNINNQPARNYGHGTTRDFLRERLAETVRTSSLCYEFMVQIQSDPQSMPIEDPTADWDDALAPFQPVALLTTPNQDIDATEQTQICRNLSFHPWQALPAHRPLGSINRGRKIIYSDIENQ